MANTQASAKAKTNKAKGGEIKEQKPRKALVIGLLAFAVGLLALVCFITHQGGKPAYAGDVVQLGIGEKVDVGGTELKLVRTYIDGECPEGAQCIRAAEKVFVFNYGVKMVTLSSATHRKTDLSSRYTIEYLTGPEHEYDCECFDFLIGENK